MAKTKKRSYASKKRRNPSKVQHKRRSYAKTTHRRRSHRRRNPVIHAGGIGKDMAVSVVGGLIGVAATKTVTGIVTSAVPALQGGLMRVLVSAVSAFFLGKVLGNFGSPSFAAAVQFGGYMQAGSDAVNVVAPGLSGTIGLRGGVGAYVPAMFPVPQNSIAAAQAPKVMSPATPAGVGRFN